jgi:LemA protein
MGFCQQLPWLIPLTIGVVLGMWVIWAFNRLVRGRNLVREGWSGIDVQLKRRSSLIPNLVEAVRAYAAHEHGVLEDVARLRSADLAHQPLDQRQDSENAVTMGLRRLLAVAEAYPDLKANRNFLDLQKDLVEIEDQIQMARRYYNGAVRDFNIRVQSFPGNLVAGLFGFPAEPFFQVASATERAAPQVAL